MIRTPRATSASPSWTSSRTPSKSTTFGLVYSQSCAASSPVSNRIWPSGCAIRYPHTTIGSPGSELSWGIVKCPSSILRMSWRSIISSPRRPPSSSDHDRDALDPRGVEPAPHRPGLSHVLGRQALSPPFGLRRRHASHAEAGSGTVRLPEERRRDRWPGPPQALIERAETALRVPAQSFVVRDHARLEDRAHVV